VIFILPETKGISLERMDALFGEIDYVEARETETSNEVIEATAYSSAKSESNVKEREKIVMEHVDVSPGDTKLQS
jgi:hypothetical protein